MLPFPCTNIKSFLKRKPTRNLIKHISLKHLQHFPERSTIQISDIPHRYYPDGGFLKDKGMNPFAQRDGERKEATPKAPSDLGAVLRRALRETAYT